MRIVITGGPRTGKTSLAQHLGQGDLWDADNGHELGMGPPLRRETVRHTDDLLESLKHLGKEAWSAASAEVVKWMDEPGPWIIEGVAVSRALWKWRAAHPGERPPVDRVIYCRTPFERLTKAHETMAKGVRAVHDEVEPWLNEHAITTEST